MKRLLLVLALFAGFSLCGDDALARRWGRVRAGHRHADRHHYRPVYRPYVRPIYSRPRVHYHGYHAPYYPYSRGVGGVYYSAPGFSIGVQF
ncbi:MAG: hypothetical protein ACC628_09420 [Pirellulaceae bacterium]